MLWAQNEISEALSEFVGETISEVKTAGISDEGKGSCYAVTLKFQGNARTLTISAYEDSFCDACVEVGV